MKTEYYKESSIFLKREMEFKVYGHSGLPCLAFACEGGRFYDWEDHGMVDALAELIDQGKIQIFCADSIDHETWLSESEDLRKRAEFHERWFNYITNELVPRILEISRSSDVSDSKILALGTSLGAGHAATLYLRRPNLFCGAIGLSGSYLPSSWFSDEITDDLILRNSPLDLVKHLSSQEIAQYASPLSLCCGQGPYEDRFLAETKEFAAALTMHRIPCSIELWSDECGHDWPWWQKQILLFVKRFLDTKH